MTPPIEQEIRERLGGGPPEDFGPPELPDEPQHLPETDEEQPGPYVITLELLAEGLNEVDAVKKAHELLQSARSKGLDMIAFNVEDFYFANADALQRVAERG